MFSIFTTDAVGATLLVLNQVLSAAPPVQVLTALNQFGGKVETEEELKPVEKLISEAYQEIDKAIVKGVLHANTGANRKSRLALAKRRLLVSAGLYTPSP